MLNGKKSILLISYYFPPIGGPRSLRWHSFSKYLVQNGFNVDVITINPDPMNNSYDRSFCEQDLAMIGVYRAYPGPIRKFISGHFPVGEVLNDSGKTRSLKKVFRQEMKFFYNKVVKQFFIPDMTAEWLPWGIKKVLGLVRKKEYDMVISSATPFTDHILGFFFKKIAKIPLIVDYGDPWVFNPFFPKWRYLFDSWIEGRILKNAERIIVNADTAVNGFISHYPFLPKDKFSVIYQGYDEGSYGRAMPEKGRIFRIVYTGVFYKNIREPYVFFEAISRLKDIDLEVVIAGEVMPEFKDAAENAGLDKKIIFLGYQPHSRAVSLQKGADLLLFFSNNSPYQLPGKIFEYMGSLRPMLCVKCREDDSAAFMVKEKNRGFVVSNNAGEIASAVTEAYNLWKNGNLQDRFDLGPVPEYSWDSQARKMKILIEEILAG